MGKVYGAALDAMLQGPNGDVARFMLRLGNRIRTGAAERCNVDTGRLRSSISVALIDGPGCQVGSDVNYAYWVHEGTAPHVIEAQGMSPRNPTRLHVLSWVGPGGRVFRRRVNHPGYRGNPFLRDAMVEEVARL